MTRQLGFSPSTYGLGAGLLFAGYAAAMVPANAVLPLLGAPRWLAVLCVAWGVVATAGAAVNSAGAFLAVRTLLGVTEVRPGAAAGRGPRAGRLRAAPLRTLEQPAARTAGVACLSMRAQLLRRPNPRPTPLPTPSAPFPRPSQAGVVPTILFLLTSHFHPSRLTLPYTAVVLGQTLAQVGRGSGEQRRGGGADPRFRACGRWEAGAGWRVLISTPPVLWRPPRPPTPPSAPPCFAKPRLAPSCCHPRPGRGRPPRRGHPTARRRRRAGRVAVALPFGGRPRGAAGAGHVVRGAAWGNGAPAFDRAGV